MPAQKREIEVVKVQEPEKLFQLIEQLEFQELCLAECQEIANQLREAFCAIKENTLPEKSFLTRKTEERQNTTTSGESLSEVSTTCIPVFIPL